MMLRVENIAVVAHAAMEALNDLSGKEYPRWRFMAAEDRRLFIEGVKTALKMKHATAEDMHSFWIIDRTTAGWTYGPVRDFEKKTHPSLRPFAELPASEQAKDQLFLNIVRALAPLLDS